MKQQLTFFIAQNIAPFEHQQQLLLVMEEKENSLKSIAIKWRQNFKSKMVMAKTIEEDWRRLENHIFPQLGDTPISQINSRVVIKTLQLLYQKGFSNALEKTLCIVVEIMDYAENTGLIEIHNCQKVKKSFHFTAAKNNPTILNCLNAFL